MIGFFYAQMKMTVPMSRCADRDSSKMPLTPPQRNFVLIKLILIHLILSFSSNYIMVSTTRIGTTALEHILTTVLEAPDPSPIRAFIAIQGITSSSAISNLTTEDIESKMFVYNSIDQTLNKSDQISMFTLQRWFFSQTNATALSWMSLTADAFDEWMGKHPPVSVVNLLDPPLDVIETTEPN